MKDIRIALVGTGFGKRVMLPAFAACPGGKVVAVCSGQRANAQAAATAHGISGIYTDHHAMLEHEALDLVVITTPPRLHWPMVEAALQKRVNILCEKPAAMNLEEARKMYQGAKRAGVLHWIDHELRFHPTLLAMKAIIDQGYLGSIDSVSFSIQWNYPIVLARAWNWWFDRKAGGGLLGALGSHQVDLVRWLLGTEFKRVSGLMHDFLKERPDAQGVLKPVTTDNFCAFSAELEGGAVGTVTLDATARVLGERERWTLSLHGKDGSLIYDGDGRLWGLRDQEKSEHTPPDPLPHPDNLPQGIFPTGFKHLSSRLVESLQSGKELAGAATFYDGMKVQGVLDAIRLSHEQGRWINPAA
ncbi:MAG TPA: Gfo/Idh/MocA family oxidoreductase [Candidatus Bipolaricaulota bacterium]